MLFTHIYSRCFSNRVVTGATDTVELCERNNISIMNRIFRGNGKVWSHLVTVHDLRHPFGIRFRAERKFSLMPPIYMQNTSLNITSFSCDAWNKNATKRKSAVENPFIKILRDDYETAYTIRWRRWWWRWSERRAMRRCTTTSIRSSGTVYKWYCCGDSE